jgi:hypothetical protein
VDDLPGNHPQTSSSREVMQFEFQQSFEFRHVPPESAATPDLMSEISTTMPVML